MSVERFPGDLRIGVLDEVVPGVGNPTPSDVLPKFQLLILLSGYQHFTLDGHPVELDARSRPAAMMMRIETPTPLRYQASQGAPLRKISLALPCTWLDDMPDRDCGSPAHSMHSHLDIRIWRPGPEVCRLAGLIIRPPEAEDPAQRGLFRMSRGLEVLRRALDEGASGRRPDSAAPPASGLADRLRLYILDHLSEDLSLDAMEDALGRNRRSLQRLFKQQFGMSPSAYLRAERLRLARRALAEDGVSVAQAAHIARYTSPANFATAFRRAFGQTPQESRSRAI
ncbi:helix-turn-helix transcriptional regulator [Oceanicola sp. S124]|uniref:helix-turn-helix transcriptional regulator n=1 Tax=Oceanicola sp. S124 TaxID=1042378 RepID=UPI00143B03E2|nr:AraC family transcriptional regulator [Oceanicola sp. S124]